MTSTGFLLIDKPAGVTSHDVIDQLRRITGEKKIGHAGTLDPFATGLLLVAVGRESTRNIQSLVGLGKTYEAEFVLGATTETLDTESQIILDDHSVDMSEDQIQAAMKQLTGEIDQVPPMYSAVKVGGRKLYELARKGHELKRDPRKITVHSFKMSSKPEIISGLVHIKTTIDCSSGTYIRALARDLAKELGTTGYVQALRRTAVDTFKVENAAKIDELTTENWLTFLKSHEDMGIDAK